MEIFHHTVGHKQNYEKLLRELQKDNLDGEEFIQIRRQIKILRPLKQNKENLKHDLESEFSQRRNLLAEWEELKASEYRDKASAAKKVSNCPPIAWRRINRCKNDMLIHP